MLARAQISGGGLSSALKSGSSRTKNCVLFRQNTVKLLPWVHFFVAITVHTVYFNPGKTRFFCLEVGASCRESMFFDYVTLNERS